ncbi:nuclear transport factor 2 family protein [[Clostridium] scindens]|uniref:SnoaL-like domain-containing protein n=1 Tax=Clostridium scindens (strain ATCC 35704 / DSM 5676 / VPI 13733 / 19) TaxID=411468 RepID=A0A494WH71_CLOS5|nr:nuclear transport factor 2 family protein [[Clostridium] scindens]QBF73622.1 hypothetical protein HDCHBGLK_00997 [[Clostridium] scindens ATCC 35704]WPB36409.1 hypothetical protein PBLEJBOC_01083 [[Clostridium] scindens]BDF18262.1 hypothetical protein CE91St59_35250 [[Clostridium] scindens]BDF21963.1 hypothetical protein CE91St60_35460 [[Clostridium] scindens]
MNHEGEELENRAARLADLYFRKHDYHQMAEYLADDVTWIGISKDRICLTKDEVLKVMEMEMKVTDGIYEILQEWHYGIEVSERVGVTLAMFFASTFWRKMQNIFGECCISKLEKVARPRLAAILPAT